MVTVTTTIHSTALPGPFTAAHAGAREVATTETTTTAGGTTLYEVTRRLAAAAWDTVAVWVGHGARREALTYHRLLVAWCTVGLEGVPAPLTGGFASVTLRGEARVVRMTEAATVLEGFRAGMARSDAGLKAVSAALRQICRDGAVA